MENNETGIQSETIKIEDEIAVSEIKEVELEIENEAIQTEAKTDINILNIENQAIMQEIISEDFEISNIDRFIVIIIIVSLILLSSILLIFRSIQNTINIQTNIYVVNGNELTNKIELSENLMTNPQTLSNFITETTEEIIKIESELEVPTEIETTIEIETRLEIEPTTEIETGLEVETTTGTESEKEVNTKMDWNLILVNENNPLPLDFSIETKTLPNGKEFDERAFPYLMQMLEDSKKDGVNLVVCSAYRSYEYQKKLFDDLLKQYINMGKNQEEAYNLTKARIAVPGTSEHSLGLAVDIVALNYQTLDIGLEKTAEFKWLIENVHKYGFILRYPKDKTDVTGIIYEPWHYRYVGEEVAKDIKERNICLEEYMDTSSATSTNTKD